MQSWDMPGLRIHSAVSGQRAAAIHIYNTWYIQLLLLHYRVKLNQQVAHLTFRLRICITSGQVKTFHILLDNNPPRLRRMFPASSLRRMEKISWKDKETNEEILHMILEDRKILNTVWYHKQKYIGHVLLHDGYCVTY